MSSQSASANASTSGSAQATPAHEAVAKAIGHCMSILDGLSNKDREKALRALGGIYGLAVETKFEADAKHQRALVAIASNPAKQGGSKNQSVDKPAKKAPQVSTKSAEEKELQKELTSVKKELAAAKAAGAGAKLPADHELVRKQKAILDRLHSFRPKAESKDSPSESSKGKETSTDLTQ